jgi:hypothetical protein
MAFTIVYKGQTISATDFNDNFYHIAQGNLLPCGGNSLVATTGVYDLGSVSYNWNNVHVQNVNLNGELQGAMNLISEVTLTTTSTVIEFTGLNGETDELYEIICNIKGYATSTVWMFPNSDSQTNNYGIHYIRGRSTVIDSLRDTSFTGLWIGLSMYDTSTSKNTKSNSIIYSNSINKTILTKMADSVGDTYIRSNPTIGQVWNNSAILTSLKFTGYFDPGTNIQLWALR